MNLVKLFEMQRKLDEHIEKEHPRQPGEDRLAKKILALYSELGELLNEWRRFKFWTHDQEPRTIVPIDCPYCYGEGYMNHDEVFEGGEPWPCKRCNGSGVYGYKNALLEEYVDCLHFILSIGLELNFTDIEVWSVEEKVVTNQFIECFGRTYNMYFQLRVSGEVTREMYEHLFAYFIGLSEMLGFTWEQIEKAYMEKNAENHARQEQGY
jgi:dimeric dUTPase (all-alpha-NTP-PPase superfamily)